MEKLLRFRGLTMLEVVVSTGILFLVMVLLLNLATTSLWGTKEGAERLVAEAHALSVLETYRARPFSSYPLNQPLVQQPYTEDGTVFASVVRASKVPGHSDTTLRELILTVTWNSQRGPREITLSNYVTPLLR